MRLIPLIAVGLALTATAAIAAPPPPEAAEGLAVVKQHLKSPDKTMFSKVKVAANGDVCGNAHMGGGDDVAFMLTKATGALWVNEGPTEPYSFFTWDSAVTRSSERSAYQAWKACQKGP
ncbi:hypothetical protein QO010_000546 [Caulobacter ginsengisoli]|uniref:Uncharacterized protein n=1 Tax=Caulobacter ginsengisoli TaxID=400775 RepID=A0ABU0ILA7_9CAUL|nr:hypothetical protein [Caulobacter ginsengisoli]MDQ0462798.1 hypothetical protein [Caulobacter ginsengisoli]